MKFIMYPHGGSGNHGCEAIVRSTIPIITQDRTQNDIILYSAHPNQDVKYGLDKKCDVRIQNFLVRRMSFDYIKALFLRYVLNDKNAYDEVSFKDILNNVKKDSVVLSIGGDNYCYGQPEHIYFINSYIRKNRAKSVLWGCSVNPEEIDDKMRKDLKEYNLIIARESITCEVLKQINANTKLYPDPAFQLDKIDLPLPENFIEGNTIGINLSPMIMGYEKQDGITMNNFIVLIQHIIDTTDMNIALIPHVVWESNNDLEPLLKLYNQFKDTKRVLLIGDHNCMELKGFISRCRMFIGARTHATIAAYSTCVPTLVVGYSVKARGIARDIFGSEKDMVIPVQAIENKHDLINAFEYLRRNEKSIREHLKEFMPAYCSKVLESWSEIKKLAVG